MVNTTALVTLAAWSAVKPICSRAVCSKESLRKRARRKIRRALFLATRSNRLSCLLAIVLQSEVLRLRFRTGKESYRN
jgi:hypothetical protein